MYRKALRENPQEKNGIPHKVSTDSSAIDPSDLALLAREQYQQNAWPLAKLQRAKTRLAALATKLQTFSETNPVPNKLRLDESRLSVIATLGPVPHFDLVDVALEAGEIVHNLRSALDAAVWDLCVRDGHKPRAERLIGFPTVYEAKRWKEQARTKLDGAPAAVVERIRHLQPFRNPKSFYAVTALQDWNNFDKHQSGVEFLIEPRVYNPELVSIRLKNVQTAGGEWFPDRQMHQGSEVEIYRSEAELERVTGALTVLPVVRVRMPQGKYDVGEILATLVKSTELMMDAIHYGMEFKSDPRGDFLPSAFPATAP